MPIQDKYTRISEELTRKGIKFSENESLARHCTFKIGGDARLFVTPADADSLIFAIMAARDEGVRYIVVGKGSNLIYPDEGFDGAVITTVGMTSYRIDGETVIADAGVSLTELAANAAKAGLSGLEFAYGIPGSVGGAVFMNAGAYDGEMSYIVTETRYIDTATGEIGTVTGEDHAFGYRESIYRNHPEWVVIGATLKLTHGIPADIEAKMQDFMSRRREKQPLEYPSAGSAFKRYPGYFTAKLIDEAGMKGAVIGGAAVSEKHAGFIINLGGATAADVRTLSDMIIEKIYSTHGFRIEREIIFVE